MVTQLTQRRVFTGRVTTVDEIDLQFGKGKRGTFEVVGFKVVTGVSALPVMDNGPLLIKHYQAGVNREGWSLPTGGLHQGETPEERMQTELQEEIGYRAARLTLMLRSHPLPGYVASEPGYLYVAEDLTKASLPGDEDYPIEVVSMSWEAANNLILRGEISDMRTLLALVWYQHYLLPDRDRG